MRKGIFTYINIGTTKQKNCNVKFGTLLVTHQTFVLMKTSWRRLEGVFCLHLQKTSWSRPIYLSWSYLFKTSSRRSQALSRLAKTSSRHLAKTSSRHLQDVFKTSSRHLQNVFKTSSRRFENVIKTSSRHLQDFLQRCHQDVFKTYYQVKLFLSNCSVLAFKTFLILTAKTVIYWRICLVHTSEKFMVSVQNLQGW